jgi:hypothetical protein
VRGYRGVCVPATDHDGLPGCRATGGAQAKCLDNREETVRGTRPCPLRACASLCCCILALGLIQ